ncbi:CRISPR-associated endonuclease Cas1, partial [bacterium]|nr:CRISPR-associated endonuclease Cas1 [bacterium]
MLSLPDFKEKQILFVRAEWGQRASLRCINDNFVFSKEGQVVNRASCYKCFAIFIIGDISVTSRFLRKAADFGVSIFFLKNNFAPAASFVASAEGNTLLRMKQYALSPESEFKIAKAIVENKAENQLRLLKSRGKADDWQIKMKEVSERIACAADNQNLLGIE